jgi:hypothetical protein
VIFSNFDEYIKVMVLILNYFTKKSTGTAVPS